MAHCQYCGQDLLEEGNNTCSGNTETVFPDGVKLPSVPYAGTNGFRCHGCGVIPSGMHHAGCEFEACPKCKKRLISCGCLDNPGDEPSTICNTPIDAIEVTTKPTVIITSGSFAVMDKIENILSELLCDLASQNAIARNHGKLVMEITTEDAKKVGHDIAKALVLMLGYGQLPIQVATTIDKLMKTL